MHWGKWEEVARPKDWGGLGIINPIIQCKAMCAKFVVKMAIGEQSWVRMLRAMVQSRGMFSKEGKWINLDWNDFLLAPSWIFTQAKGYSMAWLKNCKDATCSLEWRENIRYFKDSAS